MTAREEWREIPGTVYQASSRGRIRGPRGLRSPKLRAGAPAVTLWDPEARRTSTMTIARAVLLAFRGRGTVPVYRDGDPANVALANLSWGTWHDVAMRIRPRGKAHPHAGKRLGARGWR